MAKQWQSLKTAQGYVLAFGIEMHPSTGALQRKEGHQPCRGGDSIAEKRGAEQ